MKKILIDVLKDIKPTEKEEKDVYDKVMVVLNKINKSLKNAKAILGGSGVKGTWLKKANDADIFVKFNYAKYKDKSQEISGILEKILKNKKLKIARLHGSRDYFQIKQKDFTFEIIPILDIKKAEQAKNITDVSPLHAGWVNKKGKRFKDDIRLLKQFCKSAGVYGAESYIHGFSGYICEILTIYHKGFINTIKNAAKWGDKVIIDEEGYWKGKNILMELNKSKIISPLIIIDPVQKDRNAAAAISEEKFRKFKETAKKFLNNPSESFFEIKKVNKDVLKKKAGKNELILLDIKPQRGKEDVVGCKLTKALEYITKKLEESDFTILHSGLEWDKKEKAFFYCILKKEKLSKFIENKGPPLENKIHVQNFKKKHKKTFIQGNRIYTKTRRRFNEPKELINSLRKEDYLKEKINKLGVR